MAILGPEEFANVLGRGLDPIRGVVSAPNRGDAIRHVTSRDALVNDLFEWRPVRLLIDDWIDLGALRPPLNEMLGAVKHLADCMGLDERSELALWVDGRFIGRPPTAVASEDEIIVAFFRVKECSKAVEDALQVAFRPGGPVAVSAATWLSSFGLDWPWLASELLYGAQQLMIGAVLGTPMDNHRTLQFPPDVTRTTVEMHATIPAGEATAVAKAALEVEYKRALAQLDEGLLPGGYVPKKTLVTVERNAHWFFQHIFVKRSDRSIAAEAFPGEDVEDRRSSVRRGITTARRLLELTPHRFDPDDPSFVKSLP